MPPRILTFYVAIFSRLFIIYGIRDAGMNTYRIIGNAKWICQAWEFGIDQLLPEVIRKTGPGGEDRIAMRDGDREATPVPLCGNYSYLDFMNANIGKLHRIASKKSRLIIGLMSGTSLDGLDIALCRIAGTGSETRVKIVHFSTVPYGKR